MDICIIQIQFKDNNKIICCKINKTVVITDRIEKGIVVA